METTDEAIKNAVEFDRAAVIRLIKAHAADCERRGARMLGNGYSALVSEIEDAMHHDSAHVEALENPRAQCGGVLAYETIGPIRIHKDGVFRYLCQKCGQTGMNDGTARVCEQGR